MSRESPLEITHLRERLRQDFTGRLPEAASGSLEERERNFLSRALAAFATQRLSGCTVDEAAAAVVDGSGDAVSPHRTDWVVTNDQIQDATEVTQEACGFCWKIEQLHREGTQVTGLERCQCRKARIQRNPRGRLGYTLPCSIQSPRVALPPPSTTLKTGFGKGENEGDCCLPQCMDTALQGDINAQAVGSD